MKLSIVLAGSLLGMVGSSMGVAWWMGPVKAAAATVDPAGEPDAADAEEAAPVGAPATPKGPEATFLADGPLRVEGRLGHAALPAGRAHETYLLLDLSAPEVRDAESRAPVNVAIVLDRSGSMQGQRMTNALAAVRGMLDQLRPDDVVSLVAYADRAEVLLSPTPVRDLDAFAVSRTLAQVRGSGHTCISCGIDAGRALLRRRDGAVNRILLLSDGQANRGVTEPASFRALGDDARDERAAIASIGVDIDYDERTLLALSEASNGRHYFVQTPGELASVFEQERRALVGSVADRVDAEIALADGVELLEVVDRPHRRNGDNVVVQLGSFATGDEKTVLLRVRIDGREGARPISDVKVHWRDLVDDRERTSEGALALLVDPGLDRPGDLDLAVEARLGRKDTFDALLAANAAFARGDVSGAERELARARARVKKRKSARLRPGDTSPKFEAELERQLGALGRASSGFDDAAKDVAPTAAPATSKGKTITRQNASVADPFSD